MINSQTMKKLRHENKSFIQFLFRCLTVLFLVFVTNRSFAISELPATKTAANYSVEITKTQNNKTHRFRMHSDGKGQALLFTVSGRAGKNYQLYLFDMDSRLITQAGIRNHETTVLNNISKGNYLYEIFIEDEQMEAGQLKVR